MTDTRQRELERLALQGDVEPLKRFLMAAKGLQAPPEFVECGYRKHWKDWFVDIAFDWVEVFKYADAPRIVGSGPKDPPGEGFTLADVAEVLGCDEGDNDGPDWVATLQLKDGRYAYIEAGCDYTGWG